MLHELETLNPHQRSAVERINGRVLILAGAGSGKTRVLTLRMAYLITQHHVPPGAILGLTFTNKAAAEMRHRLGGMIDPAVAKQVTLCTFHSFCMQILRAEIAHLGYTPHFTLYDQQDVQRLVNLIARDLLEHEGELPSLASSMAAIARARNQGLDPDEMELDDSTWYSTFTRELYKRLQASMRAYNAVDFDHLLSLTVELFERFPDVLKKYQERYRYVMIDEYQDTNPIQYRLAALLTGTHHNLCVVGDDDQSIYGWRGADVRNILAFDEAFTVKLEQNYRSTNTILKAANAVIQNNNQRHSKSLWSTRGDGEKIEVFHTDNEIEEAQAVVKRVIRYKERWGLRWRDIAILYRSNALSRQFEIELMKQTWKHGDRWIQGVPFEVIGGEEFYERREVKDLCAYLRVILNPSDQEAILRIINQPRRGIGEETLDALTAYNRDNKVPLWQVLSGVSESDPELLPLVHSQRAAGGIKQFCSAIERAAIDFETQSPSDALRSFIETIDYKRAITQEVKSEQMRNFKWDNVCEFISAVAEFEKEGRDLIDLISELSLDQRSQYKKGVGEEDRVNLMTFHSAKGLEFPVCFLVGIEDHLIPHEKSLLETGLEEERRLMYVAMTRAKQHLTLSMAKRRKRMGKEAASRPSRFLLEIPMELLHLTVA